MGSALDDLIELLQLEQLEVNLFRGLSPDEDRQRVFGGQVAGQALVAAGRTVEPRHGALAARVLPAARRPARPDHLRRRPHPRRPQLHDAPRRRDPARQGDLQPVGVVPRRTRPGPSTSTRCPRRPIPSRCRRSASGSSPYADRFPPEFVGLDHARPPDRHALGASCRAGSIPNPACGNPSSSCGSAPTARCPTIRCCTTCVVAYASDLTLLDTAVMAHARSWDDDRFMIASLDHAMWFHRPLQGRRVAAVPPDAARRRRRGRGLAEGFIYRRDGALAVTVMQEGLDPAGEARVGSAVSAA